jgi:hypothetical protein
LEPSAAFIMTKSSVVSVLARAFLAGDASVEAIVARSSRTLGRPWRWLRPLARRYLDAVAGRTRPRYRDVVRFLVDDPGFRRAWSQHERSLEVEQWLTEPQRMQPVAAAREWDIPAIESAGALADWFEIELGDLAWFADIKGLGAKKQDCPRLTHYHYRVLAKSFGSVRLIEAPKPRLKALQREILTRILDRIPVHPAVHGFRQGRSIKTFVAPHVGRRVVLRMDLQDFFPSFSGARIQAFFRTAGYPESVADLLGGICTSATPRALWKEAARDADPRLLWTAGALYARPHLPQGAPTSPALANLCAYRLDCRLAGLAQSAGAAYTRYADDLAFSGGEALEAHVERFSDHVAAILMEEGFTVHHRKTRVMRQGVRQRLAGVVVNQHVNVMRPDFDLLKAILTNCVRSGPQSQNRDAHPAFRSHLEGRIAFVTMISPAKGERLRKIFDQIRWE